MREYVKVCLRVPKCVKASPSTELPLSKIDKDLKKISLASE